LVFSALEVAELYYIESRPSDRLHPIYRLTACFLWRKGCDGEGDLAERFVPEPLNDDTTASVEISSGLLNAESKKLTSERGSAEGVQI
jgi:hypothetical protein